MGIRSRLALKCDLLAFAHLLPLSHSMLNSGRPSAL
jgi:hypothetical protein